MDDADSRWCAVCDRLILPSPTIVPNPPPSPEHVAPRNQGTRSSLIDGKTRIEIDQSPAPLYCSDKCRERVTEYSADSSSSDASDDSLKEHQLEYQHRPAPPRKSTPNTRSLAIVQREYGISSLPPRTSETHDELAPCKQPAPYKPPEYTSGVMMANRHLEAVLPKSLKPGERAPPLKPVPGWTDGSQAWRAATYSFSPPPRTRADILDPSRAAYISFVASPHRSTTSGVTASAASTTSSSSAPPSPTASSSVNSASLNSELLPSFDRLSRRTLLRKPRSFPQLTGILPRKSMRKTVIDDFEMIRVLGKARTGEVLLVKHKTTADLYALKASNKRRILAHEELQHWFTEQSVLKRMTIESTDPFVVNLWWSFLDTENLFLVMDFLPGGDLGTQLARWGLLGCDRARFYAAEIVEGVEGLHAAGVIYRNLKPENILIGGDGHIVLTGFGLAKEFPRRTAAMVSADGSTVAARPPWMKVEKGGELAAGIGQAAATTRTFCGTAEYLAPEVIQGLAYSYEVDWWSFGTMLYEMLAGVTPFWANNHPDMYTRVLQNELLFPDECTMDQDTRSLIRWLLERDPALRICEPGIKRHAYFSMIDWSDVYYKRYIPPYIPPAMDDDDQQEEESDGSEEQGSEDEEGDILNAAPPLVPEKEPAPEVSPKVAKGVRSARQRHQKSGVPVLDRNLGENAEAEKADKKDEDDWDWDFVEVTKGKDRNGAKSTTLFARGVVDRYQLAVFREASTPSHRRGRAGTTFRKQTRQLSRPKSPSPSWFSSMSRLTGKRMSMSSSGEELDNLHALDRERSTDLSSVSARRPNLRKTRSNISTASSGRESSWLSGYSDAASDDSSLDSSGFSNSQGEWNGPSYDLHSHQLILKNLDLTGKIKPDRYPFESGDSADIYQGILNSSGSSISARSPFSNSGQYTTRKVAVKIFRRMHSDRESLERTSKSLYEEARIWRQLDHPNILPFLGIALDLGLSPALISPYCGSGPIMKYLQNHAKDPKEKLEMVIGVANGLAYLHSKQIIHGNLCTKKVLIDADGLPVICGYGTSKTVGQPANSASVFSAPIRFTSIRFTSPECLSAGNSAQTISADVYAFSMVMLEILSGLPPYHHLPTELAVYTHVLRGERPIRTHLDSQTVTSRIWQFLTSLWNEKPYLNTKMSDAAQDLIHIQDSDSDSDLDEDLHSASPESTHQSLRKETQEGNSSSGEETWFGDSSLPDIHNRGLEGRVTQDGQYPFAGGGNSNVYHGKLARSDGRKIRVAIKMIRVSDDGSGHLDDVLRRLKREVNVWRRLRHKNILPFIGVCDDVAPLPVLISPFYKFGHVGTYLKRHPTVDRNDLVCGVASGLQFLHRNDVIHGDLKVHNVLVDKRGAPCICDFGISKIINRRGFTTSSVGTAPYMAPELFLVVDDKRERETSPCTTKSSDVYSFALLVLEILTSEPPKGRPSGPIVTAKLLAALHPNRADYDVQKVTNTIWSVLDRCWAFDPQLRPTITEVLPLLRPQTWAPEGSSGSVPR